MCNIIVEINKVGIDTDKKVYRNLPVPKLVRKALNRKDGVLTETGALAIKTGKYTGRSPKDRFIVMQDSVQDTINWGEVNQPIDEAIYKKLYKDISKYLGDKELYVFDGFAGAMEEYRLPLRVITDSPISAEFSNQIFRRPKKDELESFIPGFHIIVAPKYKANAEVDGINSEAFVILNFDEKVILIGGTEYNGEIKKSVFSVMNYLMPEKNVFPMHCSANVGEKGDTAIFFGLSGTGKTTLSADPERLLIGDDEHGWCEDGIFNFEGGCYAKAIKLDKDKEREIFNALKFGAVLENVILDEDKHPNYDDDSLTENTRAVYPIEHIEHVELSGVGGHPDTVIFLTADAFGVIPPISKLSKEAAMYHFMSGYTSKVAGTERGITEPKATFSACFGEPFMLRNPVAYAQLLGEKIDKFDAEVYLINTGWIAGGYGVGRRMNLPYTRAMVKAAIDGKLADVEFETHPIFNVEVPKEIPGVPSELLNPKNTWEDKEAYDEKAMELAKKFHKNFTRYNDVPEKIINAGPRVLEYV